MTGARLPALFLSHGSPALALESVGQPGEHGTLAARLAALAAELPRPRAVLVASAHWETDRPAVGGAAAPDTIHDYGGFGSGLHGIRYPAPGAPAVATRVAALLASAGLHAEIDLQRGLDHGVWVPLRHVYPTADLPVLPLALQPELGAAHHHRIGRALAPLRDEGVLVLGSGGLTHNLRAAYAMRARASSDPGVDPGVAAFADWVAGRLAAGDLASLLDYRHRAPGAARHHPTEEHLLPLFVALGAAGDGAAVRRIRVGTLWGALCLDGFRFD